MYRKKRVAAYVRVSTSHEQQIGSLEAQTSYYKNLIHKNPNWSFVGIYIESGRSATNVEGRPVLRKLLADAHGGLVDLILIKSISRLSRNTVDLLIIVRELKLIGVEIFFEKESLSSFDPKCEMLLSILASLAQEKSHNLSENIKWGILRKMENGDFALPYARFLGYRKGRDGRPEIIPKEARVIQRIYWLYLNGVPINRIAVILTKKKTPAPGGGCRWHWSTVYSILTNEKYMGDALLQKTYTPNFLTHKSMVNNRAIRQYYVENSHPAIVDKETWKLVQKKIAAEHKRKTGA